MRIAGPRGLGIRRQGWLDEEAQGGKRWADRVMGRGREAADEGGFR
jgi:hypothetical protein